MTSSLPTGPAETRRYTRRPAGRVLVTSLPEASPLNAKFFRNGILMLVLVVGTVALLYTWLLQQNPTKDSLIPTSWPMSRPVRSCRSSSRNRS